MSSITPPTDSNKPLQSLDEWEDFMKERYPEPGKPAADAAPKKPAVGYDPEKKQSEFRNYEADARPTVREFYRLNHTFQTHELLVGIWFLTLRG